MILPRRPSCTHHMVDIGVRPSSLQRPLQELPPVAPGSLTWSLASRPSAIPPIVHLHPTLWKSFGVNTHKCHMSPVSLKAGDGTGFLVPGSQCQIAHSSVSPECPEQLLIKASGLGCCSSFRAALGSVECPLLLASERQIPPHTHFLVPPAPAQGRAQGSFSFSQ